MGRYASKSECRRPVPISLINLCLNAYTRSLECAWDHWFEKTLLFGRNHFVAFAGGEFEAWAVEDRGLSAVDFY